MKNCFRYGTGFFGLLLILTSCEGPKTFSVIVKDKLSQQPLDSVHVQVRVLAGDDEKPAYNLSGYTDSTGKFEETEMIGYGLSMKRWHFCMSYDKAGYKPWSECDKIEGVVELEPQP